MTATSGEKMLVVHNVSNVEKTLEFPSDNLTEPVVNLGTCTVTGSSLTLGSNCSAVFRQ